MNVDIFVPRPSPEDILAAFVTIEDFLITSFGHARA